MVRFAVQPARQLELRKNHVSALRVVLGDQLSRRLTALSDCAPGDVVLMAEALGECTYVPHHPQKIALVLSAMRHFAAELEAEGINVRYVQLDDPANTQTLAGEIRRAVSELGLKEVIATEGSEYRVREDIAAVPGIEIRADERFCTPPGFFARWARGKTTLRMEFFYREMRRLHGILMEGDNPAGAKWNFDAENRKRLPKTVRPPAPKRFPPDEITDEVLALVAARFSGHYGALEGFDYPVTARDAAAGFKDFIAHRLAGFGDWQDAMAASTPFMFHSLVSAPLNLGLLDPLILCREAEAAYHDGRVKLNAAEGFIRQILGWREFVNGIYWLHMPDYASKNALGATRALPAFYWTGRTRMRCMADAIGQTLKHAYAHHIQRLMITGNFALLAALHPDQVDEWYLAVYADAYQWVEMPNTRGMALHADGGIVGSKPYAASGAYINRMSDYCGGCHYDVGDAVGERGCPFNALYWNFIARHEALFEHNPRMAMPLRGWRAMAPAKQSALRSRAATILHKVEQGGDDL
jgi:deoxyribodipyrimidine photolyase-related protein